MVTYKQRHLGAILHDHQVAVLSENILCAVKQVDYLYGFCIDGILWRVKEEAVGCQRGVERHEAVVLILSIFVVMLLHQRGELPGSSLHAAYPDPTGEHRQSFVTPREEAIEQHHVPYIEVFHLAVEPLCLPEISGFWGEVLFVPVAERFFQVCILVGLVLPVGNAEAEELAEGFGAVPVVDLRRVLQNSSLSPFPELGEPACHFWSVVHVSSLTSASFFIQSYPLSSSVRASSGPPDLTMRPS